MTEVFLEGFQTDNLLLPFIGGVLENLLRRLLRMFIESKIVEDAVTVYDLTKIDVPKKEKQFNFEKVYLLLVYSSIVALFVSTD